MNYKVNPIQEYHPVQIPSPKKTKEKSVTNFQDVLKNIQSIKVSKHAKQRLAERDIEIKDKEWHTISKKMQEAKQKGVTDSVIITQNAALLVSTQNNTVITVMNREEAANKIFTNVNGAILIND